MDNKELKQLFKFYAVTTKDEIIQAQHEHIKRLQAKNTGGKRGVYFKKPRGKL